MMETGNGEVQMIQGDGKFEAAKLDQFTRTSGLSNCGNSYAVVAVMGAQSSGKSTLLNNLFHTKFKEMDASKGRTKTTQGVWVAKYDAAKPFIVAMDIEGSDGMERGENDTFEKQSALFALATADIVIMNLWYQNVNLWQAASMPLLRTVFQVRNRLFPGLKKTRLLFVIRDHIEMQTPLERLELTVWENIKKTWDSVFQPINNGAPHPISNFFKVEITALPHFIYEKEQFTEQVAKLRQRLLKSLSPGLSSDGQGIVPASGFSCSVQQIWQRIKENKDLHLPTLTKMVAKTRCAEIAAEKLQQLSSNKGWLAIERDIQSGWISGFGRKTSNILETYFSEYDEAAQYYNKEVVNENREQLVSKALKLVYPVYLELLGHLRSKALKNFKDNLENMLKKGKRFAASSVESCKRSAKLEFRQGCEDAAITHVKWDPSKVQEELCKDIEALAYDKISPTWKVRYEEQLNKELSESLESVFEDPDETTWANIRKLLTCWTDDQTLVRSAGDYGFQLDLTKSHKMVQELRDYARNLVEEKAKEGAANVLDQMKVRYKAFLNKNANAKKKDARFESLKLLSVMAAMRLDETPDKIESKLFFAFMDKKGSPESLPATWAPEVSAKDSLLGPPQCKLIWEHFRRDIKNCSIETVKTALSGISAGVTTAAAVIGVVALL